VYLNYLLHVFLISQSQHKSVKILPRRALSLRIIGARRLLVFALWKNPKNRAFLKAIFVPWYMEILSKIYSFSKPFYCFITYKNLFILNKFILNWTDLFISLFKVRISIGNSHAPARRQVVLTRERSWNMCSELNMNSNYRYLLSSDEQSLIVHGHAKYGKVKCHVILTQAQVYPCRQS